MRTRTHHYVGRDDEPSRARPALVSTANGRFQGISLTDHKDGPSLEKGRGCRASAARHGCPAAPPLVPRAISLAASTDEWTPCRVRRPGTSSPPHVVATSFEITRASWKGAGHAAAVVSVSDESCSTLTFPAAEPFSPAPAAGLEAQRSWPTHEGFPRRPSVPALALAPSELA